MLYVVFHILFFKSIVSRLNASQIEDYECSALISHQNKALVIFLTKILHLIHRYLCNSFFIQSARGIFVHGIGNVYLIILYLDTVAKTVSTFNLNRYKNTTNHLFNHMHFVQTHQHLHI